MDNERENKKPTRNRLVERMQKKLPSIHDYLRSKLAGEARKLTRITKAKPIVDEPLEIFWSPAGISEGELVNIIFEWAYLRTKVHKKNDVKIKKNNEAPLIIICDFDIQNTPESKAKRVEEIWKHLKKKHGSAVDSAVNTAKSNKSRWKLYFTHKPIDKVKNVLDGTIILNRRDIKKTSECLANLKKSWGGRANINIMGHGCAGGNRITSKFTKYLDCEGPVDQASVLSQTAVLGLVPMVENSDFNFTKIRVLTCGAATDNNAAENVDERAMIRKMYEVMNKSKLFSGVELTGYNGDYRCPDNPKGYPVVRRKYGPNRGDDPGVFKRHACVVKLTVDVFYSQSSSESMTPEKNIEKRKIHASTDKRTETTTNRATKLTNKYKHRKNT